MKEITKKQVRSENVYVGFDEVQKEASKKGKFLNAFVFVKNKLNRT
jgi:hypothetical protein